jgi:hypothetical protein
MKRSAEIWPKDGGELANAYQESPTFARKDGAGAANDPIENGRIGTSRT